MKYLGLLLVWCLINIPISFIGFYLGADMFYISLYFFAGVSLILLFALAGFMGDVKEAFEELEYY